MMQTQAGRTRPQWWKKGRAAALGFGVGASLALSPYVWAESPPTPNGAVPLAPQTMTSPTALMQQQSFAPLVKRVLPAVVNISVTQKARSDEVAEDSPQEFRGAPFDEFLRRFFEQHEGGMESPHNGLPGAPDEGGGHRIALGSGFIVDPSGYVVTNNHVIGEAGKVEVILQDDSRYTATIVGRDQRTDLAVLKIKADKPLPYVTFGDSGAAQIGDWVVAVGNPFGLGGSVTTGIISARGRDIHSGQFDDFLQIDAPINRGNSGGPTFNLNGEVIGINTAIYSPNGGSVGIGFAVPSNVAKTVVAQIEAHGKVSRGWLGVQIQPVTPEIAASLGLPNESGALVAMVTPNSPAEKAGLKQGDLITAFNGTEIEHLRDLPRLVAALAPGSGASLSVWRNGQRIELDTTLAQAPENPQMASASGTQDEGQPSRSEALGLHLGALTPEIRRELHLGSDLHGVVVTGADQGSVAENLGLSRGDVILSINQHSVQSPQQAAQDLQKIASSPRKDALLLLSRHGVTQYLGVNLAGNQG
ncbi:MAG: DegQ family serine endoprotease [Alphaproteobacteria bacterium]|nr:DegQ family serine endoprotease [Alphaproteobacteria bacterium]